MPVFSLFSVVDFSRGTLPKKRVQGHLAGGPSREPLPLSHVNVDSHMPVPEYLSPGRQKTKRRPGLPTALLHVAIAAQVCIRHLSCISTHAFCKASSTHRAKACRVKPLGSCSLAAQTRCAVVRRYHSCWVVLKGKPKRNHKPKNWKQQS